MSRWDSGSTCLLILTRAPIAPQSVGELAQLGERLVCNQEVTGSSPVFSTILRSADKCEGCHAEARRAKADNQASYGQASQRGVRARRVLGKFVVALFDN